MKPRITGLSLFGWLALIGTINGFIIGIYYALDKISFKGIAIEFGIIIIVFNIYYFVYWLTKKRPPTLDI